MLAAADEADQAVSSQGGAPRGRLRLSAPMSYGLRHLSRLLAEFVHRCPDVAVEVDLHDRILDLVSEGFDMAVRIGVLPDSSLVARRLAPVRMWTVASVAYLERHGVPESPAALRSHALLPYGHVRTPTWQYRVDGAPYAVPAEGRLRANNGDVLVDAAVHGLGISQLPEFLVADAVRDGRLRTLLEAFEPEPGAAHVVYPSRRQVSAAVKALADYVRKRFGATRLHAEFNERNNRNWKSQTFVGSGSPRVVVVTHPSIADWSAAATDPSELVREAMA